MVYDRNGAQLLLFGERNSDGFENCGIIETIPKRFLGVFTRLHLMMEDLLQRIDLTATGLSKTVCVHQGPPRSRRCRALRDKSFVVFVLNSLCQHLPSGYVKTNHPSRVPKLQ